MALLLQGALEFARAAEPCDRPTKFGVADPLTGPNALFGKDQIEAVRWAVEDINAKGGVDGCKLEAVVIDNQARPELGIEAANRFIDVDKAPVFLTAFSSVVRAVAPVANRTKTLMLSIGANSPSIAKLGDYVYTTAPLSDVEMKALGPYIVDKLGKRRAAILYVNNETGIDGSRVLKRAFEQAGGSVVLDESYEPDQTDFTGLILKVRVADPDVIHIHGIVADTTALISQIRQLGIKTQITSYQNAFNQQMVQQLGPAAEGLVVTALAPTAEENPAVASYVARWKRDEGREPNGLPYTQYFYDAPYIVTELFRYVREHKMPETGESMRTALLTIRTFPQPLTNAVTFKDDHTVEKPVYFWQVRDGKFQFLGSTAQH